MNNVLTYYSVTPEQIEAVGKRFGLGGKVEGQEDTFTGNTPLGDVVLTVSYNKPSGQLSVTVVNKPALLTMDAINGHIREALASANAIEPIGPAPTNRPVTPEPPPVPVKDAPAVPAAQPSSRP